MQLAVVVTDATGKPVPGLPKEAFRLRQDGQDQEIAAFENAGELPLTLALAIDSSASMFLKLPDVRRAVTSLLNYGLTDRDRAMLIDFDSKPKLVRPLTRDLAAVVSALDQLQPDGGTALWDAVSFSLRQLQGISGRKALVIYSDGIDESENATYPACLKATRESGVPIYLIVSNPREERGRGRRFPERARRRQVPAPGRGGRRAGLLHPPEPGLERRLRPDPLRASQPVHPRLLPQGLRAPRRLEQDRGRGDRPQGADGADGERVGGAAVGGPRDSMNGH